MLIFHGDVRSQLFHRAGFLQRSFSGNWSQWWCPEFQWLAFSSTNGTESTGMSFCSNRAPLKRFLVWLASPWLLERIYCAILCFRLDYFSGVFVVPVLLNVGKPSLKRTANLPLKMDGWCVWISFWDNFNVFFSFREGSWDYFWKPWFGMSFFSQVFLLFCFLICDAQSFIM